MRTQSSSASISQRKLRLDIPRFIFKASVIFSDKASSGKRALISVLFQSGASSGKVWKRGSSAASLKVTESESRSKSASEIFSAAVQDHHRGTVIGSKTFGKASVQSVIPLDEESAMKLTTARYLSPNGRSIDRVGIIPDEVIENGIPGTPHSDHQTERALELLKDYL